MNIREHIEANHYPRDDKGRALVPMRGGQIATILATDRPDFDGGREPIVGWIQPNASVHTWWHAGERSRQHPSALDLLPPPPRKVKVTRYMLMRPNGDEYGFYLTKQAAERAIGDIGATLHVVELTGEYEEPWPDAAAQPAR